MPILKLIAAKLARGSSRRIGTIGDRGSKKKKEDWMRLFG